MALNSASSSTNPGEKRPGKNGLSCNECRRSKLKCNRIWPCSACVKRGCSDKCPVGTMAATKGNKLLMAHAEQLSEKVRMLEARVRELEAGKDSTPALSLPADAPSRARQHSASLEIDHQSFDPDLEKVTDALGSLYVGLDGQTTFYGASAGSEYLHALLPDSEVTRSGRERAPLRLGLPPEILELMSSFPLGLEDCIYTHHIFSDYIPTQTKTLHLVDLYFRNAAWMYDPVVQHDFMENMFKPIYGNKGLANLNSIRPHKLAVFFIVLATGLLYDSSHTSAALLAEQYHALSRAALSLEPLVGEATCATVQALFLIVRFIYNTDRTQNEARWVIWGVTTRVAQIIGLLRTERDPAGWDLEPAEVQRRRILCWELFTHDAWTSVVNGRPPALSITHTDCLFPADLDPFVKPSGEKELGWHAWKFRYSATCLSMSINHVFKTKVPTYASVLELDKRIRQFPQPPHLQSPSNATEVGTGRSWNQDATSAMKQYCLVCERESTLLYIHRSYFLKAIRNSPNDPLVHEYALSVLATYRSACRLITSMRSLYAVQPALLERIWFFWSGIFSALIVLGALVVESPGCSLSREAMMELNIAIPLYTEGSRFCRPPATETVVKNLRDRAYNTFTSHWAGSPTAPSPSNPKQPDELAVLGGRTSVINKSPSQSPDAPTVEDYTGTMMDYYDEQGEQAPSNADVAYGYLSTSYAGHSASEPPRPAQAYLVDGASRKSKGKEKERVDGDRPQAVAWGYEVKGTAYTRGQYPPPLHSQHPRHHQPPQHSEQSVYGYHPQTQPTQIRYEYVTPAVPAPPGPQAQQSSYYGAYTPQTQNQADIWNEYVDHLGLQR